MIGPEYFLHASNITRVFSFSAKDVLWLRVFAILASLIGLPYFYLQRSCFGNQLCGQSCS
jgi:hypothetical protein